MSDNPYFLSRGSHATADEGRCAMEWVSYLAGEPHSDSPRCVSPVLMKFCIRLNDALGDERRQRLRPYLARTIGTREDGLDEHRAWLCVDWLVRVYAPAWLSLAGLDGAALRLQALPPILTVEIARCALADLDAARDAVQDAAWAAAGAVVGAATGTVVGAGPGRCLGRCRGRCPGRRPGRCRDRCRDRCRGRCRGRCLGRCRELHWLRRRERRRERPASGG